MIDRVSFFFRKGLFRPFIFIMAISGFWSVPNLTHAAPPLLTQTVAHGMIGESYSQNIQADPAVTADPAPSEGTNTWHVREGILPPGLRLEFVTNRQARIIGTPTTVGVYDVVIEVLNPTGAPYQIARYYMTVSRQTFTVQPVSIPTAYIGASYFQQFYVDFVPSGTMFTWQITSGVIPPGMSFSNTMEGRTSVGVLSGIPNTPSDATRRYVFYVTAFDAAGTQHGTRGYTLDVVTPTTLTAGTPSVPNGTTGRAYSYRLSAIGGIAPYTYSMNGGTLPSGLSLAADGTISGTPTVSGSYPFSVKIRDNIDASIVKEYTITVASALPLVVVEALPFLSGRVGEVYPPQMLRANGGRPPYRWDVASGVFPPGLTLGTDGVVQGTPTTAGTFRFNARVWDAAGEDASRVEEITVSAAVASTTPPPTSSSPLVITSASPFLNGTVGTAYPPQFIRASGGTAPYTWSVSSGAIPPGFTFSSDGVLNGTPTTAGSYLFTTQVRDAAGATAVRSSTMVVASASGSSGTVTPVPLPTTGTVLPGVGSGSSSDEATARLAQFTRLGILLHALVKLPDDGNSVTQEDSAVYYIGTDGRRHAFPNARAYFTWYTDFDSVRVVSAGTLASIQLGANVTYKPGTKLVKFQTDPKVYAVMRGGVLRWLTSESIARSLYSEKWMYDVDDVSDAFYVNYSFGTPIASASDHAPMAERSSVASVSDSLRF